MAVNGCFANATLFCWSWRDGHPTSSNAISEPGPSIFGQTSTLRDLYFYILSMAEFMEGKTAHKARGDRASY